jgi:transposase
MENRGMIASPASSDGDPARIFVAIELSKKSWLMAMLTPLADRISLHTLPAGDDTALLQLLATARRKAEVALGRPVAVVSCYEAGYDGFWLHRRLTRHGVQNHVFDPASLLVSRRARRAKTDRIDLRGLLRALLAHLRGEPKVVSVVRVPSVEEEDARRLHRERDRLIAERVQHVNRIKGLLASQGVYDYQPLRRDRRKRLAELRTGDGRALPPRLEAEIGRELTRLELVLATTPSPRRRPRLRPIPARRRSRGSPSSRASARSSPPYWPVRCSTAPSPIAARSRPMWGSTPAPSAAAACAAIRASPRRATPRRGPP